MISSKFGRGFVLAVSFVFFGLLAGCAHQTQFGGFVSASKQDEDEVKKGNFSEAVSAQLVITQNPDFNRGKISPKALQKIQEYAISCQKQVEAQLAGPAQSGLNGALPYGTAGLGTGPAAGAAFGSAISMGAYAQYGAIAYLLPGAVNGLVTGSYAMSYAKGACTKEFWDDIAKTDKDFQGTHIHTALAGKNRRGSIPPALERKMVIIPVSGPVEPVAAPAPATNPNQKAIVRSAP